MEKNSASSRSASRTRRNAASASRAQSKAASSSRTQRNTASQSRTPRKAANTSSTQRKATSTSRTRRNDSKTSSRQSSSKQRSSKQRPAQRSKGKSQVKRYSDAEIRRNRIIFALIILAIIVAIACMIHSCATNDEENVDAPDPESTQTGEWANSSLGDLGLGESATALVGPVLAQRMFDFEVDPSRTNWNFSPNGRKVVYLTIDDGPSDKTQQILDILDKYDCKATFFVIGRDDEHFPMIKEAFERGHTIGLHSYSHDYAYVYSSDQAYYDDLDRIGQVVSDQIGFVPAFIRFPGGSSNTVSRSYSDGIMSRLTASVQENGYQYYDWNASSGDGADIKTEDFVQNCTVGADERENIVLLMHDSAGKQSSVDGLPTVIEYWQAKGYTFEAIDRSTLVVHHGVSN